MFYCEVLSSCDDNDVYYSLVDEEGTQNIVRSKRAFFPPHIPTTPGIKFKIFYDAALGLVFELIPYVAPTKEDYVKFEAEFNKEFPNDI